MADTIVLVDFSSIARPIYEAAAPKGMTAVGQCHVEMIARIRAMLSTWPHAAVCCDSGKSFRHELDSNYKAQRDETPAPYLHQCATALDVLRADGYPVWSVAGFEADDLMATGCFQNEMLNQRGGHQTTEVLLVTGDKDMHQLISPLVKVFRPAVGSNPAVTYDAEHFSEQHNGLSPNQIVDYLALVGDASDNIRGADGIGPKTAAKLLAEFGNLDDLYAAMDSGKTFTPAQQKSLIEFYPHLANVRKLLTLRTDVPLPFEEIFRERVATTPNGAKMAEIDEDDDENSGSIEGRAETEPARAQSDDSGPDVNGPVVDSGSHGASQPAVRSGVADVAESSRTQQGSGQQALTVVRNAAPVPLEWELEPRSMNQSIQLANLLFESQLFGSYGTAQGVLSTILAGREMGLKAMESLRGFHIIENKPSMSAGLIHALVLRSGKAEYFRCSERADTHATFETKRVGEPPMSLTFTIDEGKRAWSRDQKAWDASGWGKNPKDMLVARASSKLARLVYPDVVHGCYDSEEIE